ncbi:MAG: 2,3-bisphosphoglycerate-independent phosphoglycerate mutase [Patescibacteria group bacterium]
MKNKPTKTSKKVILLILDGWGLGKDDASNAIYLAKTPTIDSLYKKYSWTKLCASGKCVGLPPEQVGNSEAGHLNLGAGRIIEQDVVKISKQINTGEFFKNPAFLAAIHHAKKHKSNIHLMGLLSNGQSPHSDPDHLLALLTLLRNKKVKNIYLHLFTDGRDSPPRSALKSVEALERFLRPNEIISTIIGRFYAMDRKKAWARTIMAYDAMISGTGHKTKSPQEGITRAYNAGITDEFIEPIVMYRRGKMTPRIKDDDSIIFFNLRSDRARQMAKPFVQNDFEEMNPNSPRFGEAGAPRRKAVLPRLTFVAMTDFGPDLDNILTAYPSEDVKETLPVLLKDKKQIYIAESEKYAHVTFFFNGGYANPVANEKRINIPSPNVRSYAETPAMSTAKITQKIISCLNKFDFICANFACPDMIGHTGDLKAGIKAAEAVDKYVKKVVQAAAKKEATLIITADHGNLEYMLNLETREIITEHTTNPVPFILIHKGLRHKRLKGDGSLGNVAPTILKLFGLKKSGLMSKDSLI